jgi:hypothetical protein
LFRADILEGIAETADVQVRHPRQQRQRVLASLTAAHRTSLQAAHSHRRSRLSPHWSQESRCACQRDCVGHCTWRVIAADIAQGDREPTREHTETQRRHARAVLPAACAVLCARTMTICHHSAMSARENRCNIAATVLALARRQVPEAE